MIEEVLSRLGFSLQSENASFWRATPVYRESNNRTSLRIRKSNGSFVDFSAGIKGSIYELIRLTLGFSSVKEAQKWADEHEIDITIAEEKPKIKAKRKFKETESTGLLPHYSFYTKEPRNISENVLRELECGIQMSGKQNNRFVFVIRDEDGDIVGLSGRDLLTRDHKWKHLGSKTQWTYPLSAVPFIEESRTVILVESIGDMLALRNAGFYNVLVIFGLDLSNKLNNFIASLNVQKIIICTNNDINKKENWGQLAAEKIREKLSKVIEEDKVEIKVPEAGDLGEMTKEDIQNFIA